MITGREANRNVSGRRIPPASVLAYHHDIQSAIELVNDVFDVPEKPESSLTPDDDDWLFDSERSYLEQLGHYKARRRAQNGAAELATEGDCQ